jgi:hypothetical protein
MFYHIEILTTGSFPHDNFSSVNWIFNKLGHMIPLWTGKNPIYFGVIRSKVVSRRAYKNTILYMTKGWRRGLGGKQILSLKTLELNWFSIDKLL